MKTVKAKVELVDLFRIGRRPSARVLATGGVMLYRVICGRLARSYLRGGQ